MMTALLSVGAWAASDLTLKPSETVAFGSWGFNNSGAPTLVISNWAEGGWQFDTALSQDDYCGVDFTFEATTEKHVTFKIFYEGDAVQEIDVPTGSTSIKAGFAFDGGITKIGFKYGDHEVDEDGNSTANPNGASITITSAVVKANSTGEVTELTFAALNEPEAGSESYTKDAETQSITINQYTWASYWSFDPAIQSDDYEKIVVTFAEAVPVSGLTISEGGDWPSTTLGSIANGATKATGYFSAKPGASIARIGFFQDWQAASATVKIASVKLYKKPQTVTITDAEYATCVTTAATDFSKTDGIKAYIATVNAAKTKVELTEVTKVAAGKPVILNGSAKDYTFHYTTESTDDVSANQLLVSDGTVTGDENTIYVLANGTNGVGFYLVENGSAITAGKAYLQVSGGAARQFIGFGDDNETTGIDNLTPALSKGEGVYYDLQGRRVAQPAKGLYIKNGKKVIIK